MSIIYHADAGGVRFLRERGEHRLTIETDGLIACADCGGLVEAWQMVSPATMEPTHMAWFCPWCDIPRVPPPKRPSGGFRGD